MDELKKEVINYLISMCKEREKNGEIMRAATELLKFLHSPENRNRVSADQIRKSINVSETKRKKQVGDNELAVAQILSVLRNHNVSAFKAIGVLREAKTTYLKRCLHKTNFKDK